MSKNLRIVLVALATLGGVVFVGVCMFRRTPLGQLAFSSQQSPVTSDVRVFTTPHAAGPDGLNLFLRIRTVDDEEDAILITRYDEFALLSQAPKLWPVYRYDGKTRQLTSVDPIAWKNAGGGLQRVVMELP